MSEVEKGHKADKRPEKYLWFGYGNYGGQPTRQIGGGGVRDPGLFEEFFKSPETQPSPMTCFLYTAAASIVLTVLVMLLAWGLSVVAR